MKKMTANIVAKNGEMKEISVWIDDETAKVLTEHGDDEIIRKYIIEEYRAQLIERKETRRHQSLNYSMDSGFDVSDKNQEFLSEIIEEDNLEKILSCLKKEQRDIMTKLLLEDYSQKEIAEEMGVSTSAISQKIQTIYKKIKKFLEKP